MSRQLFGTDGIRGVAGEPPLDARTAYALGYALGSWARNAGLHDEAPLEAEAFAGTGLSNGPEVLIGMDTRESGPWLAEQVAGGLSQAGVNTRFAGIITTPGVAYLTRTGPFVAGVMISASHNPYQDNGLKVIGHSGYKLPDKLEIELELLIQEWLARGEAAVPKKLAVDPRLDHVYTEYLLGTTSGTFPMRVVVDCANGSANEVAPRLFPRLGLAVEWIGNSPDGRNINLKTDPFISKGSKTAFSKRAPIWVLPSMAMQTGHCLCRGPDELLMGMLFCSWPEWP